MFKPKQAGADQSLLQCLSSYLLNRKQRVRIPGGSSHWFPIEAGAPQGSILGPLLFLIYINDTVTNIKSTVRLFTDDTSLYLIVDEPVEAARCLNSHLELIYQWAERWLVKFNAAKSLYLAKFIIYKKLINHTILLMNIYILDVFTEKPYSKPLERTVVYIPLITLSHTKSHDFKINHGLYNLIGHRRRHDIIDAVPLLAEKLH